MEFPTDLQLPPLSAADQVIGVLRKLILEGRVAPGTQLREVALAKSFAVSRNTIREALRGLTHEGLVHQAPNRSAMVVQLQEQDVRDLFEARRVLETSGADQLGSARQTELDAVQLAFDQLARSATAGAWAEVVSADVAFHKSVAGLHGSPRLARCFDLIGSELAYCLSLIRLGENEEDKPEQIIAEHEVILRAVLAGDPVPARAAVVGHLEWYEERTLEILRARAVTEAA